MTNCPTITKQEIADLLRITPQSFSNKYAKLYAAGFPKKLPHCSAWSRAAVLAWINRDAPGASNETMDPIDAARERLDERLRDARAA